ncbi:MAG TPA: RNA polymerase sigma factor [Conexibacter sp.]|nr:RNA polymerase sigma factor [Conexibacter sp.]
MAGVNSGEASVGSEAARVALASAATGPAEDPRPRQRSDAALVRAAQEGSEQAIAELFDRHWDAAHRAAYLITHDRAAAEDIAQEGFLAALRALPRFDRSRPLRPWLHRIVVNRSIDWARARRLRQEVGAEAAGEIAGPEPAALSWADDVADALARLSPEQRAVVVLRHLIELTPREIAELLELPQGTVNSRLRRGLDALGVVLAGEEDGR